MKLWILTLAVVIVSQLKKGLDIVFIRLKIISKLLVR